jgi:hypothetical protein
MLSRQAEPTRADPGNVAGDEAAATPWWWGALAFCGVAVVLWAVVAASVAWLPWSSHPRTHVFPGQPWLEGWVHWDSGWYHQIAEKGYSYTPGRQSPVAFFPAYPLLMRAGGGVVGSSLLAGILVTLGAGLAVASLAWRWFRERLSPAAAVTALALILVYPYAFYLFGVVYADALFIAAALAAFVLLEGGHPWWAGVAGAVATAARPIGLVVVAGLAVRALERRGVFPRGRSDGGTGGPARRPGSPAGDRPQPPLVDLGRARWRDAGVLVSVAGLGAWCLWLAGRFGDPFLFASVEKYWGQGAGPHTWLKLEFLKGVTRFGDPPAWVAYVSHPVVTFAALALVPRVFRRFGWGYGVYSLLAVGLAALSTKDFFGMGRYVLAAFPCFAVAGEVLADHPRVRVWALSVSAAALVAMTSLFARGSYLS